MTLDETWEPSEAQKQLPWLLVTVMVALDLVLNPRDELFPNLNAASYVGFCLGQVAVVSTWLVFGRLHFLLRLVGALGTIGCLSYPISARSGPAPNETMGALGLFVSAIAIAAVILRIRGVTIETSNAPAHRLEHERRWQFSIAALFVAMTSLGLILSAARLARFPGHVAGTIVGYCIGFSLVAVVSFSAITWRDKWIARLAACLSLVVLIGYGLAQLERGLPRWHSGWIPACIVIAISEFAAIGAVIAVIRISGYRAVRKQKT